MLDDNPLLGLMLHDVTGTRRRRSSSTIEGDV
jgi:hypothetical protein